MSQSGEKFLFPTQETHSSDSDFSSSDTDSMFLKTISKQSKGSMQDVNNIQQTWQQQQFKSDGGKSVGKNNTWRPIMKGKSERHVGFTDRVNLQDFGQKLSDHKRNITEREFIFSDSDESDGE